MDCYPKPLTKLGSVVPVFSCLWTRPLRAWVVIVQKVKKILIEFKTNYRTPIISKICDGNKE